MYTTSHTRPLRTRRTYLDPNGRRHNVYRPRPSRQTERRRALALEGVTV